MTTQKRAAKEARLEQLVPKIQRTTIHGTLNGQRTVLRDAIAEQGDWVDPENMRRTVSGYRRTDTIFHLFKRGDAVSRDHLITVERYRNDYELGVEGAKPGHTRSPVRSGFNAVDPAKSQIDALRRYRAANFSVGPRLCGILHPIVLGNMTIKDWADRNDVNESVAKGRLMAAIDRLADHYIGYISVRRKPANKK